MVSCYQSLVHSENSDDRYTITAKLLGHTLDMRVQTSCCIYPMATLDMNGEKNIKSLKISRKTRTQGNCKGIQALLQLYCQIFIKCKITLSEPIKKAQCNTPNLFFEKVIMIFCSLKLTVHEIIQNDLKFSYQQYAG